MTQKEIITPLQEILNFEADLTKMFDSDDRVAMALLEHIRAKRKQLLKKEKEQIVEAWVHGDNSDCLSEQDSSNFAEQYYNETFNTKEK